MKKKKETLELTVSVGWTLISKWLPLRVFTVSFISTNYQTGKKDRGRKRRRFSRKAPETQQRPKRTLDLAVKKTATGEFAHYLLLFRTKNLKQWSWALHVTKWGVVFCFLRCFPYKLALFFFNTILTLYNWLIL